MKTAFVGLLITIPAVVHLAVGLNAGADRYSPTEESSRSAAQREPTAIDRVTLKNGLTILLYPIPEADRVIIESFYEVGFLHEPKGMAQAAHLLEHLVVRSATKSYQAGESERLLNRNGMVNAETMLDATHYDYVVPPSDLELALQIEAERLSSLSISAKIIQQEAPRCYQEVDFVERNPRAGMVKHAFMVLNQAWRYGVNKVRVRGGLEEIPIEELERFHRASYHPKNALLVILGSFDRDRALKLVEKHLGDIQPLETPSRQSPPWAQVPKEMTVQWDSKTRAVCIAFPPPTDQIEQILISLRGNLLMQKLMADEQIQEAVDSVFCTNQLWRVKTLPFFVYATAKPKVPLPQLQRLLAERLRGFAAETPSDADMWQFRAMATELARPPQWSWEAIQQQADRVAAQSGSSRQQAIWMFMGNLAIHLAGRELLLGSIPIEQVRALQSLTADELQRSPQRVLDPSKQFTTLLLPTPH